MNKSQTDWKAIDAMEDEDIDLSDDPEVSPEQFSKAIVRKNLKPVKIPDSNKLREDSPVKPVS